jgi:predicted dehydrogenase
VECVGSVDELLRDRAVEAVLIATPVTTHFALARACLRSGRHTFVEKPLTSTAAEAEELIRIADRAGVTLMVGHTFEYSPPVVKIREIIESGTMGEIFYISAIRVNLGIHQRDVSVVWDLAPHDLSMLFYWLGEVPTAVTMTDGAFVQPLISDVAFINLQFESGKIANIQASWLSPSKLRQTTIVGSHKMLIYDDTNAMERVKVFDRGVEFKDPQTFNEFTLTYRTGRHRFAAGERGGAVGDRDGSLPRMRQIRSDAEDRRPVGPSRGARARGDRAERTERKPPRADRLGPRWNERRAGVARRRGRAARDRERRRPPSAPRGTPGSRQRRDGCVAGDRLVSPGVVEDAAHVIEVDPARCSPEGARGAEEPIPGIQIYPGVEIGDGAVWSRPSSSASRRADGSRESYAS